MKNDVNFMSNKSKTVEKYRENEIINSHDTPPIAKLL